MAGSIDLAAASTVVDVALAKARELDCHPLTVAVLDAGGHLVALKREDRSGILRVEIAVGKAYGALGMRLPGRDLQQRAEQLPRFFDSLTAASGGRLVPMPGAVLVRDADGEVLGAVGISGDLPDNDEVCAVAGIEAAGLTPDTSSTHPW